MSRILNSLWGKFNIRERVGAEIVRGIFLIIVAIIGLFGAYKLIVSGQNQSVDVTKSPGAKVNQTQISVAGDYHGTVIAETPSSSKTVALTPQQHRLLGLIHGYQEEYGATKLIIARDGSLKFAEPGQRTVSNVNLAVELMGEGDQVALAREFEILMEDMPAEYLRIFHETRWDNPFVVTVTKAGLGCLQGEE